MRFRIAFLRLLVLGSMLAANTDARADFSFAVETSSVWNAAPRLLTKTNSLDLTPVTLKDVIDERGTDGTGPYGAAFVAIEPFAATDPTVINLRAHATAETGRRFADIGMQAKATIQDRIHATWLSSEPRPDFVWGAVFRLTGSLRADRDGPYLSGNSISSVNLYGGSLNEFFQVHTQSLAVPPPRFFDGDVFVSKTFVGDGYFTSAGGPLFMQFTIAASSHDVASADTDFTVGLSFLGFQALDAQGKVIPGIAQKIGLTADSGGSYRFLESIPAVPEPSSFAATGIGLAGLLALRLRRGRHHFAGGLSAFPRRTQLG